MNAVSVNKTGDRLKDRGNYHRQALHHKRSRNMEIVAIFVLTLAMVGIGWAANDRGEVRSAGGDEAVNRADV